MAKESCSPVFELSCAYLSWVTAFCVSVLLSSDTGFFQPSITGLINESTDESNRCNLSETSGEALVTTVRSAASCFVHSSNLRIARDPNP